MLPEAHTTKTNLPPARDAFIGRETDTVRLFNILNEPAQLVTVKGAGGIGKTRLCQYFARNNLAMFPDGIWFVDLADARTPSDLLNAVSTVLDITLVDARTNRDPATQIGDWLAQQHRLLLILDNFEQMPASATGILGKWMDRSSQTQFLVTSRHPLQLRGETILALRPLTADDSIQLFRDRAITTGASWVVQAEHTENLDQLIQELDRIPLAIELVAARANQFSLATLRSLLGVPHKLLTSQRPDRPPRQQTVRDLIQWSWDLLEAWEREALIQISVFKGGFELETATAVLDLSAWPDSPWIPDIVSRLLDHSLLFLRNGDRPRYTIYTSVRTFCDQQCTSTPKHQRVLENATRRHADHFAQFGDDRFRGQLNQHGGLNQRRRLHGELDNILWALESAKSAGLIEVSARCALACATIYEAQGPINAGISILQQVLDVPMKPSFIRSQVFEMLAYLEFLLGHFDAAARNYENAYIDEKASSSRDTRSAHVHFLLNISRVYTSEGKLELAADCYDQIIHVFQEDQNQGGLIRGYVNQGDLRFMMGDFEGALRSLQEGLRISKRRGNRRSEIVCLLNFAEIAHANQNTQDAVPWVHEAMTIATEMGDAKNTGVALGLLGEIYASANDVEKSKSFFLQALRQHSTSMPIRETIRFRSTLAILYAKEGNPVAARDLLDNGLAQYSNIPRLSTIHLLCNMAMMEHHLGDRVRAQEYLSRAQGLTDPLNLSDAAPIHKSLRKARALTVSPDPHHTTLTVDEQCTWFRIGDGEPIWLLRRKSLHRIFASLVQNHERAAGGLSLNEMITAGWGEERITEESRRARVYTAVSTLRKMGLGDCLLRQADGYKLDPGIRVITESTSPSSNP